MNSPESVFIGPVKVMMVCDLGYQSLVLRGDAPGPRAIAGQGG